MTTQTVPTPGSWLSRPNRDTPTATAPAGPVQPRDEPLDVLYGTRGPAACAACHRALPPEPTPVFEFAYADSDTPICTLCLPAIHRGLAAAATVLQLLAAATRSPDGRRIARETLDAIATGVDLAAEDASPVPYTRPVRHQPTSYRRHRAPRRK